MSTNIHFFSLGNMMASGVLLGASLVHILPDSEQLFHDAAAAAAAGSSAGDGGIEYPWASFICGCSFMALLALEELLHGLSIPDNLPLVVGYQPPAQQQQQDYHHDQLGKETNGNDQEDLSERSKLLVCSKPWSGSRYRSSFSTDTNGSSTATSSPLVQSPSSIVPMQQHRGQNADTVGLTHYSSNGCCTTRSSSNSTTTTTPTVAYQDSLSSLLVVAPVPTEAPVEPHSTTTTTTNPTTTTMHTSWLTSTFVPNNEHYHDEEHLVKHLHSSAASAVALTLALSVHSLLEGLVLGMSDSHTIVSISIAILFHKVFAGFALGSTLTAACTTSISNETFKKMIYLFSVSTPIGIIVAAALESNMELNTIAVATMQAVVSGTFLYISIVEVGMKELLTNREQQRQQQQQQRIGTLDVRGKLMQYFKLICLLLGYCFMSYLAVWV